jgi:RimJ/RimL family protein N-acetyltransferase
VRHDLTVAGHAFRLRAVAEDDAAFIVALRTARAAFLNPGANSVGDQLEWLARYFERQNDYYFVVEAIGSGRREGLAGIYDIDAAAHHGEWGRWVLESGSCAAVESALLVYRCAFGRLGLHTVRCRTLVGNGQVLAFHDSCGLRRSQGLVSVAADTAGGSRAAVEHAVDLDDWPRLEARLEPIAARAARAMGAPRP